MVRGGSLSLKDVEGGDKLCTGSDELQSVTVYLHAQVQLSGKWTGPD